MDLKCDIFHIFVTFQRFPALRVSSYILLNKLNTCKAHIYDRHYITILLLAHMPQAKYDLYFIQTRISELTYYIKQYPGAICDRMAHVASQRHRTLLVPILICSRTKFVPPRDS